MNTKFATLAAHTFRYKYPNRPVHIRDNFRFPNETGSLKPLKVAGFSIETQPIADALKRVCCKNEIAPYFERDQGIFIYDYYMMIDTFKYLDIPNMVFTYGNYKINQSRFLGELITNYSASLESVTFDCCRYKSLEFITQPLTNAKIVRFHGSSHRFSNETLPIDVLFPAVEELFLDMYATNLDYFESNMPNLRHISINCEFNYRYVLWNNQQLQSIELLRFRNFHIEAIRPLFSHLGILTLANIQLSVHVRFENVTEFTARYASDTMEYLHLPKLQTFSMEFVTLTNQSLEAWIQFLREHQEISKFTVLPSSWNHFWFEQLTVELPNMVDMTLRFTEDAQNISSDTIVKLLDSHKNLLQFQLIYDNTKSKVSEMDFDRLTNTWNVHETQNGYIFKRYGK